MPATCPELADLDLAVDYLICARDSAGRQNRTLLDAALLRLARHRVYAADLVAPWPRTMTSAEAEAAFRRVCAEVEL